MSPLDLQVTIALGEQIAILKAENAALREAAGALDDGLIKTSHDTWFFCADASRGGDCGVVPSRRLSLGGCCDFYCDPCAERRLALPPMERPFDDGDLPHAAPLRALRKLLGRVG